MTLESIADVSVSLNQLHDQVFELLKRQILKGTLRPGLRLSPNAIAKKLGISETPVRDALQRLSADGLVEVIPRRGTFVSTVSLQDVKDVFQARRMLESSAAECLVDAPAKATHRLEEIAEKMDALRDGERFRDYESYIKLDEEFHQCIIGLLGNRLVSEFHEKLRWPVAVVRCLGYSRYQRAQETVAEHVAIAQAFTARDVEQAKQLIQHHLEAAEADLLQRVELEQTA
jgi:DNA-binding GntR family transcriptional regulator